jgi:hypothetical protein
MSSPARSVLGPRARVELFVLLVRQPNRAIEIILSLPYPQLALGLEPLEVGQVAQRGEAERLQEFPRRHIGERRAGLRRSDGAVDQAMTFQRSDNVAADFAPRQPGNLPLVTGCR